MGLLWDIPNRSHDVKVKGRIFGRLNAIDHIINNPSPNVNGIQRAIQAIFNSVLRPYDKHCYIHIFDKASAHYVLWVGKSDQEPIDDWFIQET